MAAATSSSVIAIVAFLGSGPGWGVRRRRFMTDEPPSASAEGVGFSPAPSDATAESATSRGSPDACAMLRGSLTHRPTRR
jgi:hypothetical protein